MCKENDIQFTKLHYQIIVADLCQSHVTRFRKCLLIGKSTYTTLSPYSSVYPVCYFCLVLGSYRYVVYLRMYQQVQVLYLVYLASFAIIIIITAFYVAYIVGTKYLACLSSALLTYVQNAYLVCSAYLFSLLCLSSLLSVLYPLCPPSKFL